MIKLCGCGCGLEVKSLSAKFIHGHHNKCKSIQERKRETCLKKYGVSNVSQFRNVKNKKKETCLKNYGVEFPAQSKEIQEKTQDTCFRNLGVLVPYQSDKVREKGKLTFLKHLNVDNPFKLENIKEQIKQTNLKNLGVEYPGQSENIKLKIKNTLLKKYGVDHWAKTVQGRFCHRSNAIKRIKRQLINCEPIMPNIGKIERLFLDELENNIKYIILRNDNVCVEHVARFPDGHIPQLKLFIQFDERAHFLDRECKIYKQDDVDCTLQLASLGYIIFRISENEWKNNKEKVINDFKLLCDELAVKKGV